MMNKKEMPLISIIVPVYKVEKYLRRCVVSILEQTYKKFELILVDDGSPDNCPYMCDEFAKQDNRIKVIHKKNGGLSDARNAGLDIAKGDYIGFVDSDDYIAPEMYEILINRIMQDYSDMACCNYYFVNENGTLCSSKKNDLPIRDELINPYNFLKRYSEESDWYYVVAWNKLYRNTLFDELRYPKGKVNEDAFLIYPLVDKCQWISCVHNPMYFYVQRDDSIMAQSFNEKSLDYGEALIEQYKYAKKINHVELRDFAASRLAYKMEEWEEHLEKGSRAYDHLEKIRKKSYFLLFEYAAWRKYSRRGRLFLKLKLLFPNLMGILSKLRK